MTTFLFAYRSPIGYEAGDEKTVAAWQAFMGGIGQQLVEIGNPVFSRAPVGNVGDDTVLGGYSLIEADSLEEAAKIADGCPLVTRGGGVEVGEITPLMDTVHAANGAAAQATA